MKKILITSVGNRVGLAILDSLKPRRAAYRLVGTNSDPTAANNFLVDTTYLVPPSAKAEAFLARMRQILSKEEPDLVFAARDGDLEGLAVLQAEPAFKNIRFISPPAAVVGIVRDKYRTYEFARAHGLPFGESIIDAADLDDLIARKGLPLIGKPRSGHGSVGVTVVRTRDQAHAVLAKGALMLQEFLNVPADLDAGLPDLRLGMPLQYAVGWQRYLSPTAVLDESGQILASSAVGIHMVAGVEIHIAPDDSPACDALVKAYAKALGTLGMIGPFNVQCRRLADGSLVGFEINARFYGTISSRACLGFDAVGIVLDYFLEGRRPAPPQPLAEPCHVVRPLADRVVREADIYKLANDGVWSVSAARSAS